MTLFGAAAAGLFWRALPWLVAAVVVAGAAGGWVWYVTSLRSNLAAATAEASTLRDENTRLHAAEALTRANAELVLAINLRKQHRDRVLGPLTTKALKEIAHARTDVPAECRPAFRPLDVSWERMLGLRTASDEADAAPAAGGVVP